MNKLEFGATLRKMRKGRGFSQEKLSEKLHISRSNISKLERNQLELKATDLVNWCKVTNHPEMLMAFVYGTDAAVSVQGAMQLITGTITFLGGIL